MGGDERLDAGPPQVESSRLWYTALHHLIDEVVFIHREDRTIAFVSPSVERVLGYTIEEFTELSTPELIHPDDLPQAVETALKLRADPGCSYRSTLRIRRASGEWLWAEIVGQNLLEEPEVRGVVQTLRDVSERHELEERLLHEARYDALTGLANRRYLLERLEQLLDVEPTPPIGVVFVDLDGFKPINDELGHAAGDEVLRVVGRRLEHAVRANDLAARFGGDEFVAICFGIHDAPSALATAQRIHDAISGEAEILGGRVQIEASVGVARADPAWSLDQLIARADAALYAAKAQGKGQVVVHAAEG